MATTRTAEVIARRGDLLAEMFLSDLGAKVVSRSPLDSVDLLAFFESGGKAMHYRRR